MKIALLHGTLKNVGDLLVLDRAKKLLKYVYPACEINEYYRNQCLDDTISEINENDIMIITGGPAYDRCFVDNSTQMFSDYNEIIIPIMCMGLGLIEISSDDTFIYNYMFEQRTKEFFERCMLDSGLLGCRDYFSMHVLRANGLSNTLMTGCPAWYDLEYVNEIEYTGIPLVSVKKICISDCENINNFSLLCDVLKFTRNFFGEERDIVFVVHRNDYYNDNGEFLLMLEEYNIKMLNISDSVGGISIYDNYDLHIGFRVHAHIYNLSKRKISVLIEEDAHGQGVNDALGLPHIPVFDTVNGGYNQHIIEHITNVLFDMISQNYDKLNEAYKTMSSSFEHMKKYIMSIERIIKNWNPIERLHVSVEDKTIEENVENETQIYECGTHMDDCELWVDECYSLYDTSISFNDLKVMCEALQIKYDAMATDDKRKVLRMLDSRCEPRQLVYLLSIIVKNMNVEGVKELLIRNILRSDYNWHEGTVVQYQLGGLDLDYVGLRRYKAQIANKYRNVLKLNLEYLPLENRNSKRIVVITGQILSVMHAPTMTVCKYLYTLQELMGYEVLVICCPITKTVDPLLWHNANYAAYRDDFDNGAMEFDYKGAIFKGYQITMEGDCLKEYHMMHHMIHMWNPICVLNYCYNPIVEIVSDYTTLVTHKFSNGLPVSDADVLLLLEGYGKIDNKQLKYAEKSRQVIYEIEQMKPYFERENVYYTREGLGLPEDKFIIAIVGNRLDTEIKDDFIALMEEIANEYSEVVFAVVGNVNELKIKMEKTNIQERVYYLGVCKHLMNVYEVMNLYLNPYRERGGYSGAMALNAGIPVITLPNCDVASNVGADFVVDNSGQIIEIVGKYIHDADFVSAKKDCIQKYNDENTEEKGFLMLQHRFEKIINLVKNP